MALLLFANNATTTLAGTLSPSATSMSVASSTGSLFPSLSGGQYFILTLISAANNAVTEIVKVTARTGDTMTIVRAQEGTTGLSWIVGDIAFNGPTAGQMGVLAQSSDLQLQSGNSAVSAGTNTITATLSPVPASYAALLRSPIRLMKSGTANSGAVTLSLNALGAVAVVLPGGTALTAGMLPASGLFEVAHDGTAFELQSVNGAIINAQLAPVGDQTVKANISGSTAPPSDVNMGLFAAALLPSLADFVGDSGAGGDAGIVPAPAAGDGAKGRDLRAAGAWAGGYFESAPIALSNGASASVAHGLGVNPRHIQAFLLCNTADLGYSVGDLVLIAPITPNVSEGVQVKSLQDDTNVGYVIGAQGIGLFNYGTGNNASITLARWSLILHVTA